MSLADDIRRPGNKRQAEDSVFKQNVSNTFGIEAKLARKQLEDFALRNPSGYKQFRNKIYVDVVQALTEQMYAYFWNFLTEGKYGDGSATPMKIDGREWAPLLPEQEVNKYATSVSDAMLKAVEEILDKVLPPEFADLATNRMLLINKHTGGIAEGAPAVSQNLTHTGATPRARQVVEGEHV